MPLSWSWPFSLRSRAAPRVNLGDRYLLVRQLAVLQKAGVPLLSSLRALESQLPPGALQETLQAIRRDLLAGQSLSQAFARHPGSFDQTFISLIQVGEAGGLLDETFRRMAELMEWEIDLRAKLIQALQYPLIVLATLTVALIIMVVFVLPNFAGLFSSFKAQLPLQTRLVLGLSRFLARYGGLLVLGAAAGAAAAAGYVRTERGRFQRDAALLRLPVVGSLLLQWAMSRFTRTVSALTAGGVPIQEVLALTEQGVPNQQLRQRIAAVRDHVRDGESLSSAMKREPLFPPVVTQMVATGEETGHLDELLRSVSDYYDQQVSERMKRLIGYLEPVLLLVVGCGVLVMASAVLVPMWDLVRVFK